MHGKQGYGTRAPCMVHACRQWPATIDATMHCSNCTPTHMHTCRYVCTTVELPAQPMKMTGIIPRAHMDVVHHILLYGCREPYKKPDAQHPTPVWECTGLPTCSDGGQGSQGEGSGAG